MIQSFASLYEKILNLKNCVLIVSPSVSKYFNKSSKEPFPWNSVDHSRWMFEFSSENKNKLEMNQVALLFKGVRAKLLHTQTIVAIGGGTVIDCAKIVLSKLTLETRCLPKLVAIPTTIGTGSEVTPFATFYLEGIKQSLDNPSLCPSEFFLVPELLANLPGNVVGANLADALAHAVESFWSIHATDESRKYSKSALQRIGTFFHLADLRNMEIKFELQIAANDAGKAIAITRTTGAHAFSYPLTGRFNIAHGEAVGYFLPLFFEYNMSLTQDSCAHPKGSEYVRDSIFQILSTLKVPPNSEAPKALYQGLKKWGLNRDSINREVREKFDLDEFIKSATQNSRASNNPRRIDPESISPIVLNWLNMEQDQ